MGRRSDRRAAEVTAAVQKALTPERLAAVGATTQGLNTAAVEALRQSLGVGTGQSRPLPRMMPMSAFGPGTPVLPAPIDPLEPSGRALPRRWEFPVSWNLPGMGGPSVPWRVLREFADHTDIARQCILVRKNELTSLDWDIVLSDRALGRLGRDGQDQSAVQKARESVAGEIDRLRSWWDTPDRTNGYDFAEWLSLALEEHFVLDALSIYPRFTLGGELHSLEILDGATIKPLLDTRGNTPAPPEPAYQQILYGFPRGEFIASPDELVDGEYTTDHLIYRPRYRRTTSPFGYSNTEVALVTGSVYLARQLWLRSEYEESAVPAALMKVVAGQGEMTPEQWREWNKVFNAELSGNTPQRRRWNIVPPGFEPDFPPDFAEKYTATFDEHLIKLLCSAYDVQPTELGFTPQSGLGGKGHEEGQENITYRRAIRPTTRWLTSILNYVSRNFLGMSSDLTFQFLGLESEDELMAEQVLDLQVRGGRRTLNDARSAAGKPLYDFEEANWPLMTTGRSLIAFGPEGPVDITQVARQSDGAEDQDPNAAPSGTDPSALPPNQKQPTGAQRELNRFAQVAAARIAKGAWRPFEFFATDDAIAERLNRLGADGDTDGLKAALAELVA